MGSWGGKLLCEHCATIEARLLQGGATVVFSPMPKGGRRAMYVCPLCARRSAKLYWRAGRFACRKCQRLRYRSQSLDGVQRQHLAIHKMLRKLNGNAEPNTWGDFERPQRMHRKSFERIADRIEARRQRLGGACMAWWLRRDGQGT